MQDLLLHVSRLATSQDGPVHGGVSHKPVVADVVEAASDVALQHPRRGITTYERLEAPGHRVRTASLLAKPIGVFVRRGLRYGTKRQQVTRLHGPVLDRGDTKRRSCRSTSGWRGSIRDQCRVDDEAR